MVVDRDRIRVEGGDPHCSDRQGGHARVGPDCLSSEYVEDVHVLGAGRNHEILQGSRVVGRLQLVYFLTRDTRRLRQVELVARVRGDFALHTRTEQVVRSITVAGLTLAAGSHSVETRAAKARGGGVLAALAHVRAD